MIDIQLVYELGRWLRNSRAIQPHPNPMRDFQACCFCGYWAMMQLNGKDREE